MPRKKTKCEVECYKCHSSQNVYYHRRRDSRSIYKCYSCNFEFHDNKDLRRSVKKCKSNEPCPRCNNFDGVYYLQKSKGKTLHHCNNCETTFISKHDRDGIIPGLKSSHTLSEKQYAIFVGHMLGDGGLNRSGVFKICRSAKDSHYLEYSINIFGDIINNHDNRLIYKESKIKGSKNNIKCWAKIMVTLSTNQFKQEFNRWYPSKKKIVPDDIDISPQTLAIWYLDDGSISAGPNKANSICLYTDNFTKNEVLFLSKILLKNFDLDFSIHKHDRKRADDNRGYYINICGKENILRFANIVDSYILEEMNMGCTRGINGEVFDKKSPSKTPWRVKEVSEYLSRKYHSSIRGACD